MMYLDPVLKTWTLAIYPNAAQVARLMRYLTVSRVAFNRALEQRRYWYDKTGSFVTYEDQQGDLTELRVVDEFWREVPVEVARDGLRRCQHAFDGFFRRIKGKSAKAGYPRFKSRARWNSVSIYAPGKCLYGHRIRVQRVAGFIATRGAIPLVGTIKVLRIVRRADKWFAQLVVDDGKQPPAKQPIRSAVGIDLGLKTFAVLSDGSEITNPRFGNRMARKIRAAHKRISRRKKGSNRRCKAILKLQRAYAKLANHRSNFVHHASKQVVAKHQLIAVENLNVAGMARGRFSKSIYDACWSKFLWCLSYKAESAGAHFIKVNPAGTTQECSGCGETVKKGLADRVHECSKCGLSLCRDQNAARNVLARALQISAPPPGRGARNARGVHVRPVAVKQRAGTVKRVGSKGSLP